MGVIRSQELIPMHFRRLVSASIIFSLLAVGLSFTSIFTLAVTATATLCTLVFHFIVIYKHNQLVLGSGHTELGIRPIVIAPGEPPNFRLIYTDKKVLVWGSILGVFWTITLLVSLFITVLLAIGVYTSGNKKLVHSRVVPVIILNALSTIGAMSVFWAIIGLSVKARKDRKKVLAMRMSEMEEQPLQPY